MNGFKLQLILKQLNVRRELEASRFPQSLWKFEGEDKKPHELFKSYQALETQIAQVQVAQANYNLKVKVSFNHGDIKNQVMTLHEAVKLVGGATRMEKLWRKGIKKDENMPRWHRTDENVTKRSKEEIYAERTVSESECMELALYYNGYANALRAVIQQGNSTEIDEQEIGLPEILL